MALAPGTTTRPPPPPSRPKWDEAIPYGEPTQIKDMPALATVWKAMKLPGKPPPVFSDLGAGPNTPWAGMQPHFTRNVMLRPDYAKLLKTLAFPGHRDYAGLQVLAHEYAHVGQPRVLPRKTMEGGAEAYNLRRFQHILKALKIHPDWWQGQRPGGGDVYHAPTYRNWTGEMMRKPQQAVERGQFGR